MHSRIFHLERSQQELEDYELTEMDFGYECGCEWFTHEVADYIDSDTDKLKDMHWFIGSLEQHKDHIDLVVEDDEIVGITFKSTFKEAYFEERLESLKNQVSELTIEKFSHDGKESNYGLDLYKIKQTIESKFGFYIYTNECNLITFDSFIRQLDMLDTTWYFGNTIDYHF